MADSLSVRDLFLSKQEELSAALRATRSVIPHSGEMGTASELQWIAMLSEFLPNRYGVKKGFVVSCDGMLSEQIDIIVHDAHFSPLLFERDNSCLVPAESVYAVFDSKQSLDKGTVTDAAKKAKSVRKLRRTSAPIPYLGKVAKAREPQEIFAGVLAVDSSWSPAFGDSFHELMNHLDHEEALQIGCAVDSGAFEAYRDEDNQLVVNSSPSEVALVSFSLGLLGLLQTVGTVVAMDLAEWGKSLFPSSA